MHTIAVLRVDCINTHEFVVYGEHWTEWPKNAANVVLLNVKIQCVYADIDRVRLSSLATSTILGMRYTNVCQTTLKLPLSECFAITCAVVYCCSKLQLTSLFIKRMRLGGRQIRHLTRYNVTLFGIQQMGVCVCLCDSHPAAPSRRSVDARDHALLGAVAVHIHQALFRTVRFPR